MNDMMTNENNGASQANILQEPNAPIIDPDLQNFLPLQTPEEYKGLTDSLLKDGCRDPLVVWEEKGILVDGHNRYRICREHNIEYRITKKSFACRSEVLQWMLVNQLARRNMSTFQRVEAVLKYKDAIAAKAKENQRASGGPVPQKSAEPMETRDVLAQMAGVWNPGKYRLKVSFGGGT